MKALPLIAALSLLGTLPARAASPIVLELFTSQGCSSCPPADSLLQSLAASPQIVALSFHVDYWDQLGWKDPFSLADSTGRQTMYREALHQSNMYTPELVIDGVKGMVGSNMKAVAAGIQEAAAKPKPITVAIDKGGDPNALSVTLSGAVAPKADIWLVTYSPRAVTAVRSGENNGSDLTSINNVTAITRIGQLGGLPRANLPLTLPARRAVNLTYGYAVLVQAPSGEIIGAGSYQPGS